MPLSGKPGLRRKGLAFTAADPAWTGIPDDGCTRSRAGPLFPLPKANKRQVTLRLDPDVLYHC
jgi:hypothetical protein